MFLELKALILVKMKISVGGSQFKLITGYLHLVVNEYHFFPQWNYIVRYSFILLETGFGRELPAAMVYSKRGLVGHL